MPKHTPGPWGWKVYPKGGKLIALAAKPHDILLATDLGDGPCMIASEEDTALIAAAPDLLEACQAVDYQLEYLQSLWSMEGITERLAQKLKSAIAKATGDEG